MMKISALFFILLTSALAQFGGINPLGGLQCCATNQIEVSGSGVATTQPDIATVSVGFSETAPTTSEAVKALSAQVNKLIAILKSNGYGSGSYETSTINIFPKYSIVNERSEIVGQTASQTITVTVANLDAKGQKVGSLVDQLSGINGILINSVNFDVANKTSLQAKARASAFKDARSKAQDYAGFAGLRVGRAITINDQIQASAPPIYFYSKAGGAASNADSTQVPLGQIDVNYGVTVVFVLN